MIKGKAKELYDAITYEYEQRGKPAKCGYCSRSFKCRARNLTDSDDDNRRRPGMKCRFVYFVFDI